MIVEIGVCIRQLWPSGQERQHYDVAFGVDDPSLNPSKGWQTKHTPYCLCMLMAEDHGMEPLIGSGRQGYIEAMRIVVSNVLYNGLSAVCCKSNKSYTLLYNLVKR